LLVSFTFLLLVSSLLQAVSFGYKRLLLQRKFGYRRRLPERQVLKRLAQTSTGAFFFVDFSLLDCFFCFSSLEICSPHRMYQATGPLQGRRPLGVVAGRSLALAGSLTWYHGSCRWLLIINTTRVFITGTHPATAKSSLR
jgi:hypothetical protein